MKYIFLIIPLLFLNCGKGPDIDICEVHVATEVFACSGYKGQGNHSIPYSETGNYICMVPDDFGKLVIDCQGNLDLCQSNPETNSYACSGYEGMGRYERPFEHSDNYLCLSTQDIDSYFRYCKITPTKTVENFKSLTNPQ